MLLIDSSAVEKAFSEFLRTPRGVLDTIYYPIEDRSLRHRY